MDIDNFNDFIHDLDKKEIIIYILLIIFEFIHNLTDIIIIDIISPFHIYLTKKTIELINIIYVYKEELISSFLAIIITLIFFSFFLFILKLLN